MRELLYKYGINLRARGDKPYINHATQEEMPKLLAVAAAMCESIGLDVETVVNAYNAEAHLNNAVAVH